MAKKIKFESFKFRLLFAARELALKFNCNNDRSWISFIDSINFKYEDNTVNISWSYPIPGNRIFSLSEIKLYVRGDSLKETNQKQSKNIDDNLDSIKEFNATFFKEVIADIALSVGYAVK